MGGKDAKRKAAMEAKKQQALAEKKKRDEDRAAKDNRIQDDKANFAAWDNKEVLILHNSADNSVLVDKPPKIDFCRRRGMPERWTESRPVRQVVASENQHATALPLCRRSLQPSPPCC